MWDNRDSKRNPKQPDFKCKDKDGCGKGVWVKKSQGGGRGGNGGGQAPARPPRPLGPLYNNCLRIAAACVKKHVPNATPADIIAAGATVFIAAANSGAPLLAAPKPKPAPEPVEEPSEPINEDDFQNEDGLPF